MRYLLILSVVIFNLFLAACSKPDVPPRPYAQVPALQAQAQTTSSNSIRLNAIQETALSVGTQGGLAWQSHQLNQALLKQQDYLNQIFNFNALILKKDVLPPVLAEGDYTLNQASPDTLRLADRVYKIVLPPRFVTAPPTWRDYLWLNFEAPDAPNATLLPKSSQEQDIWNKYVQIGWKAGIEQANEIFSANLGRLKRDYTGMILYRKLLDQNMVTPPYVATLNLGVTGNSRYMRINDQVLRITAIPQLNTNSKTWKPAVTPGEAGGEDQDADIANPPPNPQ